MYIYIQIFLTAVPVRVKCSQSKYLYIVHIYINIYTCVQIYTYIYIYIQIYLNAVPVRIKCAQSIHGPSGAACRQIVDSW